MNEQTFLTISHKGLFYYAYDTDAIVLHNLMGYSLTNVPNGQIRCGFPDSALGKVLAKMNNLQISYRIYKGTKNNPLNVFLQRSFEDTENYQKYSVRSDFSEAYDFLKELCIKCKEYQECKSRPFPGLKMTIDLEDENTYRYFSMIKEKIDQMGGGI